MFVTPLFKLMSDKQASDMFFTSGAPIQIKINGTVMPINNQALVLFEQKKDGTAIQRWRRVLAIRPTAAEPMLALAAALNSQKPGNSESLALAHRALMGEPNYVLENYQKEQLWGSRLRRETAALLGTPALRADVERAQANAGANDDSEQDL